MVVEERKNPDAAKKYFDISALVTRFGNCKKR